MNERFILGVKVNDVTYEEAVKIITGYLVSNRSHYIVTPNPEICLKAYRDRELREILKGADLAVPDGFGLKIGGLIFHQRVKTTIPGVDLSYEVIKYCHQHNLKILLLGGKGKSGTKALENLKSSFPGLKVEYLNGGQFDEIGRCDDPKLVEKINALDPSLILINLGAPKQEYFMARNKALLNARLLMGVGGTIDFISGKVRRAPRWLNRLGFEWLYRLIQEPWRWPRIINAVILFPLACIWWRLRTMLIYRRGVVGFIINNDKQILLAKRTPRPGDSSLNDHWQLPQGGVDKGDSEDEAILREMHEEVGLRGLKIIKKIPNVYKYKWWSKSKRYMEYKGQKQSLYLLLHSGASNEVRVDKKELSDYKWVSKHHILNLAHELRKPIIKIALNKFDKFL